jgi:O-methyltransferase domain
MAGNPAVDRQALVEVINLGLLWHCLSAITRLEVPERLVAGPLPVVELAAAVGADPDALWRVLRLVADHHIVSFEGDRVGLTDRGRLLCRDHPSSLSAAFATVGDSDVAHGLTETLRTGRAAAPRVLGMGYWEYLAAHPDQQALFDQAMEQRAGALSLACVPVLDWPATGVIADIAGGTGTLLAAVLQAAPGLRGVLVEQPRCWSAPGRSWNTTGWPTAARCIPGTCSPPHRRLTCICWPACCTTGTTPTRPASWPRWPTAPAATPGCGSSRCCSPPTPPRTGPR